MQLDIGLVRALFGLSHGLRRFELRRVVLVDLDIIYENESFELDSGVDESFCLSAMATFLRTCQIAVPRPFLSSGVSLCPDT